VNFWEGLIDEMVIVNKALSENEINQLMAKGASGILAVDIRGKLAATWGDLKN
jgi:hypothetical protein